MRSSNAPAGITGLPAAGPNGVLRALSLLVLVGVGILAAVALALASGLPDGGAGMRLAWIGAGALVLLLSTLGALVVLTLQLRSTTRQMRQTLEMQASVLRDSVDGIVICDTAGRITDFSNAAERIFGRARGDLIGKVAPEVLAPPAHRAACRRVLARLRSRAYAPARDRGPRALTALHATGRRFPVEVSLSTVSSMQGTRFVVFVRDVTAHKATRSALAKARNRAVAAAREKSRYFAVMSHEMRTPLTGLLASLDLLKDTALDRQQARFLQIAETSGQLLLGHINDVLTIERLDSGQDPIGVQDFEPAALLRDVVGTLTPMARAANTTLAFRHDGFTGPLCGDRRALTRVVMNLVGNAIKFTAAGAVTVTTDARPSGDDVSLRIEVRDTGIGMSKAKLAEVFEDFVTTPAPHDKAAAGTGLGLGIVRRLVDRLGGTLDCDSAPGRGTCFRVTLPMRQGAGAAPVAEPPPPAPVRSLRILLVEDNALNREVMAATLDRMGHAVSVAQNGVQGVRKARACAFDLILMDIGMAAMTGIEATRQIRRGGLSCDAPIIAVTAHAMPGEAAKFERAGMDGCLVKPVDQTALCALLARIGTRSDSSAAAVRPATKGPALDAARVREVADLLGREAFDDRVSRFAEEACAAVTTIQAALKAGDPDLLRREAHRLSGSCAVLGAIDLAGRLQRLETAAKRGDLATARSIAADIDGPVRAAVGALRRSARSAA